MLYNTKNNFFQWLFSKRWSKYYGLEHFIEIPQNDDYTFLSALTMPTTVIRN